MQTLADKYRPHDIDSIIGQPRLVGPNGVVRNMLMKNRLQSCIFYGPPGCGKTTTAQIIAHSANLPFASLNATQIKLEDIRHAVNNRDDKNAPILLYLDEIQYFNTKQQQSLLPYIENNDIILIGATTDNPYHCCQKALLSRCVILEFHPIDSKDIEQHLINIAHRENIRLTSDAAIRIADTAAGDIRRALNLLDLFINQCTNGIIDTPDILNNLPNTNMSSFDTAGDDHYALISALQKSIRGSDPNAAVFYLARLLEGGDILSPCRRLLVIAHEDIGLGNPNAIPFVHACIEDAKELGLPEAAKPLTNAVLYLALSQKCSTAENTYNRAVADIRAGKGGVVPRHLRNACTPGYLYPHNYPNHWVRQQYLPDDLNGSAYYIPETNPFEQQAVQYWSHIIK